MNKNIAAMIEIKPLNDDDFKIVLETLSRIGIAVREPKKRPKLISLVNLLHKGGRYFLCHYRHVEALNNKEEVNLTDDDISVLWQYAEKLERWGLIGIVSQIDETDKQKLLSSNQKLIVIKSHDKVNFDLYSRANLGS